LPTDANVDQKTEHARQEEALVFYNKKREEIRIYYGNLLMDWGKS
jgi:hypothetical protein